MVFKLNSAVCVWRIASLGHLNLKRGMQFRYSSSGTHDVVRSNSCSYCGSKQVKNEMIKPLNKPLLSSNAPCLLIPFPKVGGTPDYCFYSLAEKELAGVNNVGSKSHIVGSSHGWLAYINLHRDDYVIGDEYSLFLTNPFISTPAPPTIQIPCLSCIPKKLVMSSPPSLDEDHSTQLMALDFQGSLAYYKMGRKRWDVIYDVDEDVLEYSKETGQEVYQKKKYTPYQYTDIVFSSKDQMFYCIDCYGQVEAWNLRRGLICRMSVAKEECSIQKPDCQEFEQKQRSYYLVVDSFSGDILIVVRYFDAIAEDGSIVDDWESREDAYSYKTIRFKVYKINMANKIWEYVDSLGDGVVFVGHNQSFMVSAGDFSPGVLMPNSIHFTENEEKEYENLKEADMGIYYNLGDFSFTPIFPAQEVHNMKPKEVTLTPTVRVHHPFDNFPQSRVMWFNPNPC